MKSNYANNTNSTSITKDDSLLKLEKKLDNATQDEIILNRFKVLKPNIDNNSFANKGLLDNVGNFLKQLKQANEDLEKDPELKAKMNIEAKDNKGDKFVEMNLGLGVLEAKPDKDDNLDMMDTLIHNINNNGNDENEDNITPDEGTAELLKFLLNNKEKKSNKIHKKKKKNIQNAN